MARKWNFSLKSITIFMITLIHISGWVFIVIQWKNVSIQKIPSVGISDNSTAVFIDKSNEHIVFMELDSFDPKTREANLKLSVAVPPISLPNGYIKVIYKRILLRYPTFNSAVEPDNIDSTKFNARPDYLLKDTILSYGFNNITEVLYF